jgi:hypothetical protein
MRFRHRIHAADANYVGITPKSLDPEMRELWRELARPVTFFDLCSPSIFLSIEIGEFPRKWRARQARTCDPRLRRSMFYPPELRAPASSARSVRR